MNRKNIIVIIITAIASLAVGAFGATYVQQTKILKAIESVSKEISPQAGPLVDIGEFTVNLQGDSYLKTSITLEGADKNSESFLKEREPFIKDTIISVLTNKSVKDIDSPQARERLRRELLDKLNQATENQVKNVLFVSFVYQ